MALSSSKPTFVDSRRSTARAGSDGEPGFAGAPLLVLGRTKVMRIVIVLVLPFVLLAAFASLGLLADKEWLGGGILFVLGWGALALLLRAFRRELGRQTRIYADGIEQVVAGRTQRLRFATVREVWLRAVKVQAGGLIGAGVVAAVQAARKTAPGRLDEATTNITVRVVGEDGTLKLTSNDTAVVAGFEEVLRRVNPRLLAEARTRLGRGEPVRFGKATLTRETLGLGGKPVPFAELESVEVKSGKLYLKKKGKWLASTSAAVSDLPNVFVLTDLCAELTGAPRPGSAAAASRQLL